VAGIWGHVAGGIAEEYGDHFFIGRRFGLNNVVCWHDMAS
jgi:hypothetical protein